jgi:hypothetical protein
MGQMAATTVPDAFANGTVASVGADPDGEPTTRCRALRLPDRPVEPDFLEFRPF